jgi:quercetin 2,3-dioxygenase
LFPALRPTKAKVSWCIALPTRALADFDPLLLLDEMGPMNCAPGEAKGAPDHPHRGFETVAYMLSGSFEHKDSQGHSGKIARGDVQWTTAAGGALLRIC